MFISQPTSHDEHPNQIPNPTTKRISAVSNHDMNSHRPGLKLSHTSPSAPILILLREPDL